MRTGLNFLQALVGLTTIGAALVACGDDSATGAGGGGGGSATSADATTVAGPGPSVTSSTGGSPVGPGPASTGSGGQCTLDSWFQEPECDECFLAECCAEAEACLADFEAGGTDCVDADGAYIEGAPLSEALFDCRDTECVEQCYFFPLCDSGIGFTSPDAEKFGECLNEFCCEGFDICTDNGNDPDGCLECLNSEAADYSRCEDLNACSISNCDDNMVFVPVCDSGLGVGNIPYGQCLDAACCDAYNACTGTQSDADIDACIACLEEGDETGEYAPLCAALITCEETNCSLQVCDTSITFGDPELAGCASDSCCAEFTACTGDGSEAAVDACIECFNADKPGPLCEAASTCLDTNCGGGEGGGGGGTAASTGGAGGAGGGI